MGKVGSYTITNNSKKIVKEMGTRKAQALEAIGMKAESHAKDLTPVDTSRLRNSITHIVKGDAAYIGTSVYYAPYVEFGTRRGHKAHHMLKRAATEFTDEYRRIVKAAFGGK